MKCWVDVDELYPWHTVLVEEVSWLAKEYDIPQDVVTKYDEARAAFMKARKELMKAMNEMWDGDE